MDISEVKKEKEIAEKEITRILNELEMKTKLNIYDITVDRGFVGSGGMMMADGRFPLYVSIKVSI